MWKRIVAIGGTAVLLAAVAGHAASASVGGRTKMAAGSSPAGPPATVNRDAKTARSYWTPARPAAAKPIDQVRTGPVPDSFGTAVLDFTRSRITPQACDNNGSTWDLSGIRFTAFRLG